MARYIKKEDIKYESMPLYAMPEPFVRAKDIEAMPDEDVAPVVHARWNTIERVQNGEYISRTYECSHCAKVSKFISTFCPHCGSMMNG